MNEGKLIIDINRGELAAFQQLYNHYYIPLCTYSKRFTRSREIAEEVVQDVFLTLWEQQGRLIITGSLKAYLFASVRNRCLDHLKHLQVVNKFNEHYTLLLTEAEDLYIFSQESGDAMLIANELEKSVTEAIDSLPEQCRKIFMMSRFEGLRHQDIADSLGVTLNTVQRQMSIALEKLRVVLKKYLTLFLLLLKFLIS
jgi:RNA polymerase sigma-70 factor (ECF subfamily)